MVIFMQRKEKKITLEKQNNKKKLNVLLDKSG